MGSSAADHGRPSPRGGSGRVGNTVSRTGPPEQVHAVSGPAGGQYLAPVPRARGFRKEERARDLLVVAPQGGLPPPEWSPSPDWLCSGGSSFRAALLSRGPRLGGDAEGGPAVEDESAAVVGLRREHSCGPTAERDPLGGAVDGRHGLLGPGALHTLCPAATVNRAERSMGVPALSGRSAR